MGTQEQLAQRRHVPGLHGCPLPLSHLPPGPGGHIRPRLPPTPLLSGWLTPPPNPQPRTHIPASNSPSLTSGEPLQPSGSAECSGAWRSLLPGSIAVLWKQRLGAGGAGSEQVVCRAAQEPQPTLHGPRVQNSPQTQRQPGAPAHSASGQGSRCWWGGQGPCRLLGLGDSAPAAASNLEAPSSDPASQFRMVRSLRLSQALPCALEEAPGAGEGAGAHPVPLSPRANPTRPGGLLSQGTGVPRECVPQDTELLQARSPHSQGTSWPGDAPRGPETLWQRRGHLIRTQSLQESPSPTTQVHPARCSEHSTGRKDLSPNRVKSSRLASGHPPGRRRSWE